MIRWNKIQDKTESYKIQQPDSDEPTDIKINAEVSGDIPEANSIEEIKEGCCDIFQSRHFLKIIAICPFGW